MNIVKLPDVHRISAPMPKQCMLERVLQDDSLTHYSLQATFRLSGIGLLAWVRDSYVIIQGRAQTQF